MDAAVRAGQWVVVATVTRGELGTDDPAAMPPERLARLREHELAASLAAVGVADHRWLEPAGAPLVDGTLHSVDDEIGARMVGRRLADVRPDTIVTFGPDGLTGHADHRAISRWSPGPGRPPGARGSSSGTPR